MSDTIESRISRNVGIWDGKKEYSTSEIITKFDSLFKRTYKNSPRASNNLLFDFYYQKDSFFRNTIISIRNTKLSKGTYKSSLSRLLPKLDTLDNHLKLAMCIREIKMRFENIKGIHAKEQIQDMLLKKLHQPGNDKSIMAFDINDRKRISAADDRNLTMPNRFKAYMYNVNLFDSLNMLPEKASTYERIADLLVFREADKFTAKGSHYYFQAARIYLSLGDTVNHIKCLLKEIICLKSPCNIVNERNESNQFEQIYNRDEEKINLVEYVANAPYILPLSTSEYSENDIFCLTTFYGLVFPYLDRHINLEVQQLCFRALAYYFLFRGGDSYSKVAKKYFLCSYATATNLLPKSNIQLYYSLLDLGRFYDCSFGQDIGDLKMKIHFINQAIFLAQSQKNDFWIAYAEAVKGEAFHNSKQLHSVIKYCNDALATKDKESVTIEERKKIIYCVSQIINSAKMYVGGKLKNDKRNWQIVQDISMNYEEDMKVINRAEEDFNEIIDARKKRILETSFAQKQKDVNSLKSEYLMLLATKKELTKNFTALSSVLLFSAIAFYIVKMRAKTTKQIYIENQLNGLASAKLHNINNNYSRFMNLVDLFDDAAKEYVEMTAAYYSYLPKNKGWTLENEFGLLDRFYQSERVLNGDTQIVYPHFSQLEQYGKAKFLPDIFTTLLHNSMKNSVDNKIEFPEFEIKVERADRFLYFEVTDNGVAGDVSTYLVGERKSGLMILVDRLNNECRPGNIKNNSSHFAISVADNGGTKIKFRFPYVSTENVNS